MKILITGAAGFIGYHLAKSLMLQNHIIIGLDNINDYYDVALKRARIENLGIRKDLNLKTDTAYKGSSEFIFYKSDITNLPFLKQLFKEHTFEVVIHLAAQAGVRYSISNPDEYIKSNIQGFYNVLSCCKEAQIAHFMYASSSSVYGNAQEVPFRTDQITDKPISLYAATKKTNELLAYSYSHLYDLKTTGLRFFTVYGPWGRPDMAYYKFANAISKGEAIPVYNHGNLERDFTHISDIIQGIGLILSKGFISNTENEHYAMYNIGKGSPVKLMDFIGIVEKELNKKAIQNMLPMQDGDVYRTWADITDLQNNYGYQPSTAIEDGIADFAAWYTKYHEDMSNSIK